MLTEALFREEKKMDLPQLKLVLDAKWRWGYSYKMIARYLQVEKAVLNLPFNGWEWKLSEEDVACLRAVGADIKEIVEILFLLEGEKYPTFSMVIPILNFLKSGALRPTAGDSVVTKAVRRAIEDYVDDRYIILPLHRIATLLDPRFVQLQPFVPGHDKDQWLRQTTADLKDLADTLLPNPPEQPMTDLVSPVPTTSDGLNGGNSAGETGNQAASSSNEDSTSAKEKEPVAKKQKVNPFFCIHDSNAEGLAILF